MNNGTKALIPLVASAFAAVAFATFVGTKSPAPEEPVIAEEDQKYVEQCTETSGFKILGISPETSTISEECIKMARWNDILENGTAEQVAIEMAKMEEEFVGTRTSYFGKATPN